MLAHHELLPPRKLQGKQGVLDYIARVGCIQFDPINVVGGNPDLVLQSRLKNYQPALLQQLLYKDRKLIDGFDKVASIYQTRDWPYFSRFRKRLRDKYAKEMHADGRFKVALQVREALKTRGPLSSIEIEHEERLVWDWGTEMRVVRATMDLMYWIGELGIHHRVHSRRVFDVIENLIPKKLLQAADPNLSGEDYADWHVLRRIGSIGFAHPGAGERWLGMEKVAGTTRKQSLERLLQKHKIVKVRVTEIPQLEFYIRASELPLLEVAARAPRTKPAAAFLAPLDNLLWHRDLLELLFDFYYRWEVYVPAPKRMYGYYVLPVLCGEHLVARLDPAYERSSLTFKIQNWWWETGVNKKDEDMLAAIREAIKAFAKYLGANKVTLGAAISKDRVLKQLIKGL